MYWRLRYGVYQDKGFENSVKAALGVGKECLAHKDIAFNNLLEALASLSELQPDVAFLDIEMPKLNGLELA